MSFILDALKKVERQKAGTGEIRVAEGVLGRKRSAWRRGGTAALVGIALLSAIVTALAMRYFVGGGSAEGDGLETAEQPAELSLSGVPAEALDVGDDEPAPGDGRADAAPPPEPRVPSASREPSREAAPAPSASPPAVSGPPPAEAPSARSAERPASVAEETEPEGLLLQGTAVLDGEPVAVINDQRVFVGDHVGGALVISIEPGRVVLERDGERVELSL